MRTLVFDCRTGAVGDMTCAALIAVSADPDVVAPVENELPVRYDMSETTKTGSGRRRPTPLRAFAAQTSHLPGVRIPYS